MQAFTNCECITTTFFSFLYNLLTIISRKRRIDHRTRRDRAERRNRAFQQMAEALADAYMAWDYEQTHGDASVQPELGDKSQSVRVIDLFGE